MNRRPFLLAALPLAAAGALTLLAALPRPVQAQEAFPSKPVTVFTAFAPGSGPDAVLRIVADKLGKAWNQRVTVENRPGGGGFIAIDAARRAAPDGHTLLQLDSEHLAALPHLYKARGFDTLKAFDPVTTLFRTNFLVAVQSESKLRSMADLIGEARGGKVNFGSWGVGSPGHLGGEQLELLTGVQMQHVPFREVSQLYTAVGGGEPTWSYATLPSSQGAYKAGKIRYIAVAAARRLPQLPDVPTVAEAGGPAGVEVNSFVVLVAPKGLPPAVRDQVHADVQKVLAEPEVKARYDTFAFENVGWNAAAIEREAQTKSKLYGELVRRKAISLD